MVGASFLGCPGRAGGQREMEEEGQGEGEQLTRRTSIHRTSALVGADMGQS
jgi:hypothetical protein